LILAISSEICSLSAGFALFNLLLAASRALYCDEKAVLKLAHLLENLLAGLLAILILLAIFLFL
jgi:hypothetical protein